MRKDRNGIPELEHSTGSRSAIIFDCDPATRDRLRNVSRVTGISQRAILVAGTHRQLKELERQLAKGTLGLSQTIETE